MVGTTATIPRCGGPGSDSGGLGCSGGVGQAGVGHTENITAPGHWHEDLDSAAMEEIDAEIARQQAVEDAQYDHEEHEAIAAAKDLDQ